MKKIIILSVFTLLSNIMFAQTREEIFESYLFYAQQGNTDAQASLAHCYIDGLGTEKNYEQAIYWLKLSLKKSSFSQYNLGYCFENGFGVPVNMDSAIYYYKKASKHNETLAIVALGRCYQEGIGVKQSHKKAIHYYEWACERHNVIALWQLGNYYKEGEHIRKNTKKAKELLLEAANKNLASAQYDVALLLYQSEDNFEIEKANYWMKRAAGNNYRPAIEYIQENNIR